MEKQYRNVLVLSGCQATRQTTGAMMTAGRRLMAIDGTPAQLLALIKSDMERWRALVRDRQIKLE